MENINRIIKLLKNVVFPIKKRCEYLILQQHDVQDYQVFVSLHEKNGIYQGGFPINESVLDISNIDNESPNVIQYKRYISNLEYIKINCYGTNLRGDFCCPHVFYCDLNGYKIDVLNKFFNYDEFPNEQEVSYIVEQIKKEIGEEKKS